MRYNSEYPTSTPRKNTSTRERNSPPYIRRLIKKHIQYFQKSSTMLFTKIGDTVKKTLRDSLPSVTINPLNWDASRWLITFSRQAHRYNHLLPFISISLITFAFNLVCPLITLHLFAQFHININTSARCFKSGFINVAVCYLSKSILESAIDHERKRISEEVHSNWLKEINSKEREEVCKDSSPVADRDAIVKFCYGIGDLINNQSGILFRCLSSLVYIYRYNYAITTAYVASAGVIIGLVTNGVRKKRDEHNSLRDKLKDKLVGLTKNQNQDQIGLTESHRINILSEINSTEREWIIETQKARYWSNINKSIECFSDGLSTYACAMLQIISHKLTIPLDGTSTPYGILQQGWFAQTRVFNAITQNNERSNKIKSDLKQNESILRNSMILNDNDTWTSKSTQSIYEMAPLKCFLIGLDTMFWSSLGVLLLYQVLIAVRLAATNNSINVVSALIQALFKNDYRLVLWCIGTFAFSIITPRLLEDRPSQTTSTTASNQIQYISLIFTLTALIFIQTFSSTLLVGTTSIAYYTPALIASTVIPGIVATVIGLLYSSLVSRWASVSSSNTRAKPVTNNIVFFEQNSDDFEKKPFLTINFEYGTKLTRPDKTVLWTFNKTLNSDTRLDITSNQTYLIAGPNGSGKSIFTTRVLCKAIRDFQRHCFQGTNLNVQEQKLDAIVSTGYCGSIEGKATEPRLSHPVYLKKSANTYIHVWHSRTESETQLYEIPKSTAEKCIQNYIEQEKSSVQTHLNRQKEINVNGSVLLRYVMNFWIHDTDNPDEIQMPKQLQKAILSVWEKSVNDMLTYLDIIRSLIQAEGTSGIQKVGGPSTQSIASDLPDENADLEANGYSIATVKEHINNRTVPPVGSSGIITLFNTAIQYAFLKLGQRIRDVSHVNSTSLLPVLISDEPCVRLDAVKYHAYLKAFTDLISISDNKNKSTPHFLFIAICHPPKNQAKEFLDKFSRCMALLSPKAQHKTIEQPAKSVKDNGSDAESKHSYIEDDESNADSKQAQNELNRSNAESKQAYIVVTPCGEAHDNYSLFSPTSNDQDCNSSMHDTQVKGKGVSDNFQFNRVAIGTSL